MISDTGSENMFDLHGQRAVIIGGTGVLGGEFSICLSKAGADIVIVGRSQERGNAIVQKITDLGGRASFIQTDVTERKDLERASSIVASLGGTDILVNAAGVNSRTPFNLMDDTEWDNLLNVNLSAVFRACQIFAPQMSDRPSGASIINISSTSSGPPLSNVVGYAVAKAGVNNLTQFLARELAPEGIRVNAIVPGFFPAEQNRALLTEERLENISRHTPMRRLGKINEINGTLLWLASSKASSYVTGSLVRVDGGFSAMTI